MDRYGLPFFLANTGPPTRSSRILARAARTVLFIETVRLRPFLA
jgi:hypothetical protein